MSDSKKVEKRKLNPKASTYYFGKKKFVKGMKKPRKLPENVEFPEDFFEAEKKVEKKTEPKK